MENRIGPLIRRADPRGPPVTKLPFLGFVGFLFRRPWILLLKLGHLDRHYRGSLSLMPVLPENLTGQTGDSSRAAVCELAVEDTPGYGNRSRGGQFDRHSTFPIVQEASQTPLMSPVVWAAQLDLAVDHAKTSRITERVFGVYAWGA